MRKKLLLVFFIFIWKFSSGQAITGAAAAFALDEMQDGISQVIEDAENAGNNIINNGAFQVNTAIFNFRETYKDVLKSSEQFLDAQAYNIFLGIRKTTEKILSGATDFIAELDNTITSLHSVMVAIPGISKKPFISKTLIPTMVRNSSNDDYEIQFIGSLLDSKSKFKINGNLLKPSENTTKRLTYHLEGEALMNALEKRRANFELKFRYGGLFKKTVKYSYFAKVIPLEFAKVDVLVSTVANDTIKIQRAETLPATRTDGSNYRGKRKKSKQAFTIYPTKPTNEILVSSIDFNTIVNRYGYGADIVAKSPASILISQHARSEDEPFGGGGKVQSRVSFTELQITQNSGTQEIKELPLIFYDPLVIKLPNNTTAVQKITVKFYNGKTITLTTENDNKNFEVDYRKLDKTLFIRNIKI